MSLTFDEALEQLNPRTIWSPEMRDLLEQLRATYAPTVEMTKAQYDMLIEGVNLDHTSNNALAETLSADDYLDDGFDEYYWKPLTDRQVAQAWLYPECIKVVE